MLRMESETGWWLITHPDHARLAGAFSTHWGNDLFPPPEPRASVLYGIHVHDDGWTARDAHPSITRAGKPSAFSHELVGKYSAFEEIDLADYLAVRESAVQQVEAVNPYAALLVCMHTYSLLTEHADRSTIAPAQLPLLDVFLERQRRRQENLRAAIRTSSNFAPAHTAGAAILHNFHLLQATDNLSLLSCVAYLQPATLLHAFPTATGVPTQIAVTPVAPRHFRLAPYPFDEATFTCHIPGRHVEGKLFRTSAELAAKFAAAEIEDLAITISA
jgi:Protein of unknown function (DUF3891)